MKVSVHRGVTGMSRGLSKRRQHFKEVCEEGRPVGRIQRDFISDATGVLEIIEH